MTSNWLWYGSINNSMAEFISSKVIDTNLVLHAAIFISSSKNVDFLPIMHCGVKS